MKLQKKNSIMMAMIFSLLLSLGTNLTFADDSDFSSETLEDTTSTAATTYVSDEDEEEEAPTATATSFEDDTSVINSADSDSDF
jgi:hypothetical protein